MSGNDLIDPVCGSDGNRGLVDDDRPILEVGCQGGRRCPDLTKVGFTLGPGRGIHRDEAEVSVGHRLGVTGGETQSTGCHVAGDQFLQPGFLDRQFATLEAGNLRFVNVEADHTIAEISKARTGDQAYVAGPDNTDLLHECFTWCVVQGELVAALGLSGLVRNGSPRSPSVTNSRWGRYVCHLPECSASGYTFQCL